MSPGVPCGSPGLSRFLAGTGTDGNGRREGLRDGRGCGALQGAAGVCLHGYLVDQPLYPICVGI